MVRPVRRGYAAAMSKVTIYHNPACSTSRKTLALIRDAGIEPTIIEYLRDPPTREQLVGMISAAGLTARQAMRDKGDLYEELGLSNPADAYTTGGSPNIQLSQKAISPTGNTQPHQNMQPYLTVNFCIALSGVFPTRG